MKKTFGKHKRVYNRTNSPMFIDIDSIAFIYEENLEKVNNEINIIIKDILTSINTYEQWEENKDIYLTLFNLKILSIFDYKIKTVKVKSFIERIKASSTNNIQISESILKYVDKLELVTEISANDALKLIKINNISEGIKKFKIINCLPPNIFNYF